MQRLGYGTRVTLFMKISRASVCMFGVVNRSNAKLVILCTNFWRQLLDLFSQPRLSLSTLNSPPYLAHVRASLLSSHHCYQHYFLTYCVWQILPILDCLFLSGPPLWSAVGLYLICILLSILFPYFFVIRPSVTRLPLSISALIKCIVFYHYVLMSSQQQRTASRRLTICRQSSSTQRRSTADTSLTSIARSVPAKYPTHSTTTTRNHLPPRPVPHLLAKLWHRMTQVTV